MRKNLKFFFLSFALILLLAVVPVFAQETPTANVTVDEATTPTPKFFRPLAAKDRIQAAHQKNLEIRENLKNRASEAAQKREERLSQARLNICKARAKNIGNRLKAMYKNGITIHKGHEKIFSRVDEFYNNKLVPNGYTLSNYADLKAEIEANKANVLALHESAKATGLEFSCESEDPKGHVDAFREDMKELIEANKVYKESIHTFVKAVRDLAKTAKLEKLSGTPAPTVTEGATQ